MRILPTGPGSAPERGMFNSSERTRLIWMGAALLLVATTFGIFLRNDLARRPSEPDAPPPAAPAVEEVVVTPPVSFEQLRLARDATPEERVVVESEPLAAAFPTARLLSDVHFKPMGGRVLDQQLADALVAQPEAERGKLLRAYGWIESLESREATLDLPQRVRGHLRLEQGGHAWFTAIAMPPEGAGKGDFVRIDGIFLKVFRGETESGFLDAPLLVAPRVVNSKPALGAVTALPPDVFLSVENDSLERGLTSLPYEPYWTLLGYSRDMPPDAVDWSQALLLDKDGMARIAGGAERLHGAPVRIPTCEMMGIWSSQQKENPLRVTHVTEGWLGSHHWIGPSRGLLRFTALFPPQGFERQDEVVARGFFLKNLAYEPRDGGIEIAPFFVLHSLELAPAVDNSVFARLLYIAGGALLVLVLVLILVIARDRRHALQLQEQLTQRRRARRAREA